MTESDIYQLVGKAYCDGMSQGMEKQATELLFNPISIGKRTNEIMNENKDNSPLLAALGWGSAGTGAGLIGHGISEGQGALSAFKSLKNLKGALKNPVTLGLAGGAGLIGAALSSYKKTPKYAFTEAMHNR